VESTHSLIGRRYQLQEVIGAGGMGEVLRARDRLTGRDVALKRVQVGVPMLGFDTVPNNLVTLNLALAREFQTLSALRHPNIISVLDYGFEAGNASYFTMELLHAPQTILSYGWDQPLPVQLDLIGQVLQALIYLHRHGVLHRDLKPSNLLVYDGRVKVVDFGLASHFGREDNAMAAGTLRYMPPEILSGQAATVQSDLYSLGVVFLELLTDQRTAPEIHSVDQWMQSIIHILPDFDTLPIPPELKPVLMRLQQKRPEDRYASATEALHALQTLYHTSGQGIVLESPSIRESFIQAAPFIGRADELLTLRKALHDASADQGGVWWIGGESGVGKSRLVNEIRIQALVNGVTVAAGETRDMGNAPYETWRTVIRQLALNVEIRASQFSALSEIVPDLGDLLERELPPLPALEPKMTRARLFAAIAALVRKHPAPLLIVLDDLHWADSGTLDLLDWITSVVESLPILILATWRDDERPHLHGSGNVLHLKRMTQPEIVALSSAIFGRPDTTPEVVNFLYRETEGNAFFLVEFIRAMAENAGRLDQIRHAALPTSVTTDGVQQIIRRRLDRIPPAARPLLELAAIAGRVLDLPVLQAAGISDPAHHLSACSDAAVLEVAGDRWRFSHDKLREATIALLPDAARPALHERIADAIRLVYADTLEAWYTELAHHYHQSGNTDAERRFAGLAGRQAAAFASRGSRVQPRDTDTIAVIDSREITQQALTLLGRALELTPATDWAESYDLLQARERIYDLTASRDAQWADLERLQHIVAQTGNRAQQAEIAARVCTWYELRGDLNSAIPFGRRALALAEQSDDPELQARTIFRLGRVVRSFGEMDEAAALFRRGIALSQQHGLRYLEGQLLRALAFLLNELRLEHEAVPYALAALAIAREMGDRVSESWALIVLGEAELSLRNDEQTREHLEEAWRICRETGDRWGEAWATRIVGHAALNRYDWLTAREWFERGMALSTETAHYSAMVTMWLHTAILNLLLGDLDLALAEYRRVVAYGGESGFKILTIYGKWGEATVLLAQGDAHAALISAQESIMLAEEFGSETLIGNSMTVSGQAHLVLKNVSAACDAFQHALALLKKAEHPISGVEAEAGLIRVALHEGDLYDAPQRAHRILDVFAATDKRKIIIELGDLSEIYLACHDALHRVGHPRAAQVIDDARRYLSDLIEHLPAPAARTHMLEALPARRRLWGLVQAAESGEVAQFGA
jgi:tetratricopeptide (TPR) repeat protein